MMGATAFVMESSPNTLVSAQRNVRSRYSMNGKKRTKDCAHVLEGLLNKRTVKINARIVNEYVDTPLLGHKPAVGSGRSPLQSTSKAEYARCGQTCRESVRVNRSLNALWLRDVELDHAHAFRRKLLKRLFPSGTAK